MLHYSKIIPITERRGPDGKPIPFNFKYKKFSSGELISAENAISLSSYYANGTVNVRFANGETRKLQVCLFTEFNEQEIFL